MTFNALIPELIVSDLDRSRKFYLEVLNFTFEYEREGFLFLSREGAQLMLEQQKKEFILGVRGNLNVHMDVA